MGCRVLLKSCGVSVAGGSTAIEVSDKLSGFLFVLHCAVKSEMLSYVDREFGIAHFVWVCCCTVQVLEWPSMCSSYGEQFTL